MFQRFSWLGAFVCLFAVSCDKSKDEPKVAEANPVPAAAPPVENVEPPSVRGQAAEPRGVDGGPAPSQDPGVGNTPPVAEGSAEARRGSAHAPAPEGKVQPHPGHCDPAQECPEGQGCSGLFFDASGQCIPLEEAKAKCAEKKGEWGTWGARPRSYCMRLMADGGKPCTDGSQCESDCIQEQGAKGGKCQKYEIHHGCYSRVTDGKPGTMLCVD